MTVSNILSPIFITMDRFLIGAMVSVAAVAYYATPYEAATKLCIIPTALASVLFPAFSVSSRTDTETAQLLFTRAVKVIYLALLPLSLIIIFFANDILEVWLGSEFAEESTLVLQLFGLGVFYNSLAHVPFAFIQGHGRPDITAKIHLLEFPLYIAMVLLAIKYYGIKGAAFVWAIRMILDAVLLFTFAGRIFTGARFNNMRSKVIATVTAIMLPLAFIPANLDLKVILAAIFLVLYLLITWFYILSHDERQVIRAMFRRKSELPQ
jgi:O-antigen/teichoic acid export membrane protein